MEYKNHYYGNILDPIHGQIKLSEIEKWILTEKPFNRLRKIKQNTFLYYVFPSANHTRFEHSIGVMHLASKIFEACLENYATGNSKRAKYRLEKKSSFFDIKEGLGEENSEILYQELRLAALMHDIGHGPMSHSFDDYTISMDEFLSVIENDNDLKPHLEAFRKKIIRKNKVEHEIMSCLFVLKLIGNLKVFAKSNEKRFSPSTLIIIEKLNSKRIVKMIEHDFPLFPEIEIGGLNYTSFFTSIISSFPMDADRMDYLLRDSYFSGVKYGIYDISRLFSSFIPIVKDDKVLLTIKESGADSVIRFIQSRTHLFNQVYYHKTNRAANVMLSFALKSLKDNSPIMSVSSYSELEEFYWKYSDEAFLSKMHERTAGVESEVFSEFLNRRFYKRIFEKRISLYINSKLPEHESIDNFDKEKKLFTNELNIITKAINSIAKELEQEGIYIYFECQSNEAFKDSDKTSIQIAKKSGDTYEFTNNWAFLNKDFMALNSITYMCRVFIRRNFHSSPEFLKNKNIVLDKLKEELEKLDKY